MKNTVNLPLWRKILWPVQNHETKIFLWCVALISTMIFNLSILRDMKDVLLITKGYAADIPLLMAAHNWIVMPILFGLVMCFGRKSSSITKIFSKFMHPYMMVLGIFVCILLPLCGAFSDTPPFGGILGKNIQEWIYFGFYILARIAGNGFFILLTWQFLNHIIPLSMARRFYGHFFIFGSLGILISDFLNFVLSEFDFGLLLSLILGSISTILGLIFYKAILKTVNQDNPPSHNAEAEKNVGFFESIAHALTSKPLWALVVCFVGYEILNHTIYQDLEHILRSCAITSGEGREECSQFRGLLSTLLGSVSMLSFFMATVIAQTKSWKTLGFIAPVIVVVSSITYYMLKNNGTPTYDDMFVAFVIVILIKGIAAPFFILSKELFYVHLSPITRSNGKIFIDGILKDIGKSWALPVSMTFLYAEKPVIVAGVLKNLLLRIPQTLFVTLIILIMAGWFWGVHYMGKKTSSVK